MKAVQIATTRDQVELPNGFAYDEGDVVMLTDEQYSDLDKRLFPSYLVDVTYRPETVLQYLGGSVFSADLPIALADVTGNGSIAGTAFTPGFAGSIISWRFITTVPATTAAKLFTFNLDIATVLVTKAGPATATLAITSANQATAGVALAGDTIAALNVFTAAQAITAKAASTTAFIEGSGVLQLILKAS